MLVPLSLPSRGLVVLTFGCEMCILTCAQPHPVHNPDSRKCIGTAVECHVCRQQKMLAHAKAPLACDKPGNTTWTSDPMRRALSLHWCHAVFHEMHIENTENMALLSQSGAGAGAHRQSSADVSGSHTIPLRLCMRGFGPAEEAAVASVSEWLHPAGGVLVLTFLDCQATPVSGKVAAMCDLQAACLHPPSASQAPAALHWTSQGK